MPKLLMVVKDGRKEHIRNMLEKWKKEKETVLKNIEYWQKQLPEVDREINAYEKLDNIYKEQDEIKVQA